jgi:hypothetical protein
MPGYLKIYNKDTGRWETHLTCPQCARFREKMDREKMAKVLASQPSSFVSGVTGALRWEKALFDADALIKYLTE